MNLSFKNNIQDIGLFRKVCLAAIILNIISTILVAIKGTVIGGVESYLTGLLTIPVVIIFYTSLFFPKGRKMVGLNYIILSMYIMASLCYIVVSSAVSMEYLQLYVLISLMLISISYVCSRPQMISLSSFSVICYAVITYFGENPNKLNLFTDYIIATFIISLVVYQLQNRVEKYNELKRKMERMEVFGDLTARMAHEIRNPLTVLKTSLSILRRSNLPEDKQQLIDMSEQNIERIKSVLELVEKASQDESKVDEILKSSDIYLKDNKNL